MSVPPNMLQMVGQFRIVGDKIEFELTSEILKEIIRRVINVPIEVELHGRLYIRIPLHLLGAKK